MKQKLLILLLFLANAICFAQDLFSGGSNSWIFHTPDDGRTTLHIAPLIDNNYNFNYQTMFYNNGDVAFSRNVGIGTTVPDAPLTVFGLSKFYPTRTSGGDDRSLSINYSLLNPDFINNLYPIILGTGGGNQPLILDAARVGIGTSTPEAKLDVNGTVQINGGADGFYGFGQSSSSKPIDIRAGSHYPYVFNWHEGLTFSAHSSYGGIRFYNQGYPDMFGTAVMVMSITNNNVGIGTTNPTSKLTVAGNINSREVKVTVDAGADFVFDTNYNLPSLDSVDKYIKANKHLPEIASADEMKKEGINLSEMNIKLLQKLEEMTLYMIDMKKELAKQKQEIEQVKSKMHVNR